MTPSNQQHCAPKDNASPRSEFEKDVIEGLSQDQKSIPCKYLYDQRGSQLFDAITKTPEYYPTRTEIALLEKHANDIATLMGDGAHLIEFGSGSSVKVRIILDAAPELASYVPVDISHDHLKQAAALIAKDYPNLDVLPVAADFTKPFSLPESVSSDRKIGFFPGSTIGNFTAKEAAAFLANAARMVQPGGALLIGADLIKDSKVINAAYNDKGGVTSSFSLNLLRRINREIGGDFDAARFRHQAQYNPNTERVEIFIESREDQAVRVNGESFNFTSGERIHTENSHKYDVDRFQDLARKAGFTPRKAWVDDEKLFSVHYLEVPAP